MYATYRLTAFGKQMRKIRKLCNLTQANVQEATGVNIDTLRRIENGSVIPKFETLEILSGVYKVNILNVLNSFRVDNQITEIYRMLDKAIVDGDSDRVNKMNNLNDRIERLDRQNIINKNEVIQLSVFAKATSCFHGNGNYEIESTINELCSSLGLTLINFKLSKFKNYVYSTFELRVLLLIGLLKKNVDQLDTSNEILIFCLDHVTQKDYVYSPELQMLIIKLYYNISYNYYNQSKDILALDFAEKGIQFCMSISSYYCLSLLFARKATAQLYLGMPEYKHTYKKALSLLYITDDIEHAEYIRKRTYDLHNVKIDSLDLSDFEI